MATVNIYPTSSDTSVQQWSNSSSPSQKNANRYLNFDEVTADDDSSYVQCATTTHSYENSKFSDPALNGKVINSVTFHWRVKHVTATGYSRPIINKSSTGATKNSTTSYQNFSETFTTNPITGDTWQYSEIYGGSAYWFGIEGWASATKSNNRLTQFYLTIDYSDAPTGIKFNGVQCSKFNGVACSKLNGN